ncbi:MAG: UDP-N-acetylmuramate--L-alanine ligase [Candidatus Caenarcaniphilales bacterium]|nr:UDP-N-acetylmuramate--L-alanine ligase [Candidatus Caenarcaniphilales bacterium]
MSQTQILPKSIHFLGIGGAGMNPLSGICLKNGITVTGSDSTANKNQEELRKLGADIWTPHSLEELKRRPLPEVCAYSTAILPTNEEYKYLKEQGVEFWHRSDLLRAIASQFKKQIVISGTHGKTTTTAMLIWLLERAGLKPCWVLGGVLKDLGSYGWNNEQREVFIFEGDESDQSFLKSNPFIGLVTSLEPDHLENYQNSFKVQIQKFQEFAEKSKTFICSNSCSQHFDQSALIYSDVSTARPDASWSLSDSSDSSPIKVLKTLDLSKKSNIKNTSTETLKIPKAPGKHNMLNALGAIAIADLLDISIEDSIKNLYEFPGIYRRFEIIGKTENGITVVDDYAHHPTEVKAAIEAGRRYLKEQNSNGHLIVLFQPHLPTRLRDLWKEFTKCFEGADHLFLSDLYIARGEHLPGIDCTNLAKQIKHNSLNFIEGSPNNLVEPVLKLAESGDLILILGAGDITYIRETLYEKLRLKHH